jgi:hypothetical protein
MIQLPALSYPPEFIPLPFNWFQFAMLYIAGMELLLLALPKTWFVWIFRTAFPWNDHKRKRRMELSKPIPPISNDLPGAPCSPTASVGILMPQSHGKEASALEVRFFSCPGRDC